MTAEGVLAGLMGGGAAVRLAMMWRDRRAGQRPDDTSAAITESVARQRLYQEMARTLEVISDLQHESISYRTSLQLLAEAAQRMTERMGRIEAELAKTHGSEGVKHG